MIKKTLCITQAQSAPESRFRLKTASQTRQKAPGDPNPRSAGSGPSGPDPASSEASSLAPQHTRTTPQPSPCVSVRVVSRSHHAKHPHDVPVITLNPAYSRLAKQTMKTRNNLNPSAPARSKVTVQKFNSKTSATPRETCPRLLRSRVPRICYLLSAIPQSPARSPVTPNTLTKCP